MISCESRENLRKALSDPNTLNSIAEDAFHVADKDRNGCIDIEEFELCMKNVSQFFGFLISINEIKKEFNRLDADNNGVIDFDEFKKYVKEIVERILVL